MKNKPLCVIYIIFCEFNKYSVNLAFIVKITSCFDVLNSCLLCEMLPIMQLTPVAIVCMDERMSCMFVTLTVSFLSTIYEL